MHQDSPSNQPFGAQVIQTNALSTPVFVVLVLALFIAALVSAVAIVLAISANNAAVIAEREARLAQRRYDDMRIYLEVHGIDLPEN